MNKLSGFAGATAIVAAGWFGFAALHTKASARGILPEPVVHPSFDASRLDREVAFHQWRVQRDPKGAIGWSMLSAAYLARSREFDRDADSWNAESAARMSLKLRRKNNVSAAGRLVQSLLEQHRFHDAEIACREAMAIDPQNPAPKRLHADVLVELGRYDEAQRELASLGRSDDPSSVSVRARIASLRGDHRSALMNLEKAYKAFEDNPSAGAETLAWYKVKLASELRWLGQRQEAESTLTEALALHPRSYKAALAMAHLRADQKRWREAATWANKVLATADSLEAKSLLVDAYAAMGDAKSAAAWTNRIRHSLLAEDAKFTKLNKGGPLHVRHPDRAFAQFCLEHKVFVADALVAAKRDMANRPDAHAKQVLDGLIALKGDSSKFAGAH